MYAEDIAMGLWRAWIILYSGHRVCIGPEPALEARYQKGSCEIWGSESFHVQGICLKPDLNSERYKSQLCIQKPSLT